MSKSSDRSSPERRTPQRQHGERRVITLLDAADAVIAQHGYGGTTMTLIAEHAGSAIGTVYQYFSDKDAVVYALSARYADEMASLWPPLAERLRTLDLDSFVTTLMQALVRFMTERPAYVHLIAAPKQYKRDEGTRFRLRESFAALLRDRDPQLSRTEALLVTGVALRIIMSVVQEYARAKRSDRDRIVEEFSFALKAYLTQRIRRPIGPQK
ncbi:TetR/AcrR family transcriptional regulator [Edaphobacter modestus]|uniref:TetR family transcriptional regulator n=1 Tax=Edaphobacter modestus TaxID=388466 RepID=A0A4Q7XZ75_9BACT|nr:TetR/AcrR family transcriptional regulator [Edaphobacter modestus]RZU29101.1 TetR family transcriptional regulator [Edaphobacter modestus]